MGQLPDLETKLMIERGVLSLALLAAMTFLLSNSTADHFTAILGFSGPLLGGMVNWWFRINGNASEHNDMVKLARSRTDPTPTAGGN